MKVKIIKCCYNEKCWYSRYIGQILEVRKSDHGLFYDLTDKEYQKIKESLDFTSDDILGFYINANDCIVLKDE